MFPYKPMLRTLRDVTAVAVVACFSFPILWTVFDSIKPGSAVFDKNGIVFYGFEATLENYATVLGWGPDVFDSRRPLFDSMIVATGAAALALAFALPASFALWHFGAARRRLFSKAALVAWMVPPITLVGPLFWLYHTTGLFDTRLGLTVAEAAIHLPFAILVLTSFFNDMPSEIIEAAKLDGATGLQTFTQIALPMVRGGSSAVAILLFILCWTEFLLAVYLTAFTRTVPVHVSNMSNAMGGSTMAFSTTALLPCFVFVLLVQKHLARGLSLGLQR